MIWIVFSLAIFTLHSNINWYNTQWYRRYRLVCVGRSSGRTPSYFIGFVNQRAYQDMKAFSVLLHSWSYKNLISFLISRTVKNKSSVLFTRLFCACMYRMYESIIYKGLKRGSITCSASKRGDSTGIFMASVSKSGEFPFIHACKL